MKSKTIQSIDMHDLDDLVQKTYGRPYSFQQQDGCKSRGVEYITVPVKDPYDYEGVDSIPETPDTDEAGVSFATWLARDPKQPLRFQFKYQYSSCNLLELWWHRNFYPSLDMIANDLHAKGLWEAGEYQIVIDW